MPYLIALLVALVILFFAIWIVSILFLRLLGLVVGYSVVAAAFTFLAGLIWGIVLPMRVLRGHTTRILQVASPHRIRDGHIFKGPPRGASKDFGWDPAWPLYVPYQLRLDAAVVRADATVLISRIRERTTAWWPKSRRPLVRPFLAVTKLLVLGVPVFGLIAGLVSGVLLWMVIIGVFQALVSCAQWITMRLLRTREVRHMKKHGATIKCTRCYRETKMPSYRCSNPDCTRVHRDVNPGPLGIRSRICECGTQLPLTVAAASGALTAHCPFCEEMLPQGTGSRRVVVAPVFGSVGSGKTQFLATAAISLQSMGEDQEPASRFTPLTQAARQFLADSVKEAAAGSAPLKTQHQDQPEGYPFLVSGNGTEFELHLMDAAGENFVHADDSRTLGYLDISPSLLFLLDPLSVPEVREQLALSGSGESVQVAQGQANDAYGSVVDRLRDSGEDLTKKKLAVLVTKADIIGQLFPSEPMPADSTGVRAWLYSHGSDNLIRRIEADFQDVDYFGVDSSPGTPPGSLFHPLRVIDWLLKNGGGTSLFGAGRDAESTKPLSGEEPAGSKSRHDTDKKAAHS